MTLRGYGVLVVSIVTGTGAVLFASRFLLTMSAFFFSTLIFSFIWMAFHREKLSVQRSLSPEYVYENSDVVATLVVTHATTQCSIRDYFDNGKKTTRFFLPRASKGLEILTHYKFHVDKRGVYTIGPLIVRATDALGLVAREYSLPHETHMRVYPRIRDVLLPQIPLRASEHSRHMDRNASTTSADLLGLREYTMGDDVRLIHWKTSSRTQDLYVRHRERQATLPLVVILDCNALSYAQEKEFDSAARLIASISYACVQADIPCTLFCNDNGEFVTSHALIMDRLAMSQTKNVVQSPADSNSLLHEFEHNYLCVTGSQGEISSSAILTLRIVPDNEVAYEAYNLIPVRQSFECTDFSIRIKQWNAHASFQSLS
ncbi:MAG TPA: DUF58 domain-containing protein [Acidimicrobiia bacterium]|nr:DUF58 domain-containing protein [Acidimicrobiia bacterium]